MSTDTREVKYSKVGSLKVEIDCIALDDVALIEKGMTMICISGFWGRVCARGRYLDGCGFCFSNKAKPYLETSPISKIVYLAPQQEYLHFNYTSGYVRTVVPVLTGHQMIVFEIA